NGATGLFFQGTPPIGFTNALGVVHAGLVFAGSVSTTDGTSATAQSGGLFVLDANGNIVTNLGTKELINGPWGMAINDRGGSARLADGDAGHLHGLLGLIFAPNGNLLVANADPAVSQDANEPSEIVEFTRGGQFVRQYSVDPNRGSAFALGIASREDAKVFAY